MHFWFISASLLSALDPEVSIKTTPVEILSVVSEEIDAMWRTKLGIRVIPRYSGQAPAIFFLQNWMEFSFLLIVNKFIDQFMVFFSQSCAPSSKYDDFGPKFQILRRDGRTLLY